MDNLTAVAPTAVLPYLRQKLEGGAAISQAFLESVGLEEGNIFSTLPPEFPPAAASDPISGGVAGPRPLRVDQQWTLLAEVIHECLISDSSDLYVAEAPLVRVDGVPRDPPFWFHDGQTVYFVGTATDPVSRIRHIIDISDAPWISIGLLTSLSDQQLPQKGARCDDRLLAELGRATTTCVVGAYDQEAHLIWRQPMRTDDSATRHAR